MKNKSTKTVKAVKKVVKPTKKLVKKSKDKNADKKEKLIKEITEFLRNDKAGCLFFINEETKQSSLIAHEINIKTIFRILSRQLDLSPGDMIELALASFENNNAK